jgi:hypothetical protein
LANAAARLVEPCPVDGVVVDGVVAVDGSVLAEAFDDAPPPHPAARTARRPTRASPPTARRAFVFTNPSLLAAIMKSM